MVFSELMEIIQRERNLAINEVAEEIGITPPSFKNLLYKKVLKPDSKTCQKILSYCQKHSIDVSDLDWNEILYEYFLESGKYSDYAWVSDLDYNNHIKIRHKTCGRSTLAPISAFDGISTLCIHCWFEKFVSEDAYTLSSNEFGDGYEVYHKTCGNKYPVTYEQIKQKKYRCPKCNPYSRNANSLVDKSRGDYSFVGQEDKIDISPKPVEEKPNIKPNTTIEDIHMSVRDFNILKRSGFYDITKIIETPIKELRFQIRDRLVANILRQLDARGIRKTDCSRERYPTIDDYFRQNLKCTECFSPLSQEGSNTVECLCKDCIDRLQRVNSDKLITIDIKPPVFETYSNGREGVTIFVNLINRTNAPLKVKLQEFTLTHCDTQKISDYHYTGYNFDEDYLFPDTIKAIGKIWVTEQWVQKTLSINDYCVIILKSVSNNKQYYYKFTYEGVYWKLYDYYELD